MTHCVNLTDTVTHCVNLTDTVTHCVNLTDTVTHCVTTYSCHSVLDHLLQFVRNHVTLAITRYSFDVIQAETEQRGAFLYRIMALETGYQICRPTKDRKSIEIVLVET